MELACIGAIARDGVRRLALTQEDGEARAKVISWARQLGMSCHTDRIGNIFLRHQPEGSKSLDPVVTGSHLDTEPNGGRFDGVFGVLAGLEAVEALKESGHVLRRPIEVAIWTNEEGCRFQPAYMGSAAFVAPERIPLFLTATDGQGISVNDALTSARAYYQVDDIRDGSSPMRAYVEAHIEQGPVLENTGKQIGIVTDIYGIQRFEIDIVGEAAHAGTTPLQMRKDAVVVATRIVQRLQALCASEEVRLTVGKFEVAPSSATVVPERVTFTLDIRHPDQSFLDNIPTRVRQILEVHVKPCAFEVRSLVNAPSVAFDPEIQMQIESAASALQMSFVYLASGAGHDARYLAEHCPSAMIFVPSHKGISHSPAEYTSPTDLGNGARVLTDLLFTLTR